MTHHSRYIQLVVQKNAPILHLYSYCGECNRGTEVEEGSDAVVHKVLTAQRREGRSQRGGNSRVLVIKH